jgi:hypothetical protein
MSDDAKAVIERRECADCGTPMHTDGRILCPHRSEHIGTVVVRYVPESELRLPVEDARWLAERVYEFLLPRRRRRTRLSESEMVKFLAIRSRLRAVDPMGAPIPRHASANPLLECGNCGARGTDAICDCGFARVARFGRWP